MKRRTRYALIFLLGCACGALLALPAASGCQGGEPDSVELGCESDSDCFEPGQPERWCQKETGICLGFTSPPGPTEQPDGS